ncbi:MAG: HEAT repeat domain-containing protein [Acidobacteria bacterium]|nr:HEAT repeat domain-containing protein [Acidobacteriota bacterium]
MHDPQAPSPELPSPSAKRRPPWLLILLTVAFVLVPYLFWRGTWFGRPLSDEETAKYFADTKRPRRTQHALVQIAERIERGDPSVRRWYPEVQAQARHELPEIRATAAWVMGQDNQSEEFHRALLELLADIDPLVRRNAALALVRFGDASGKPEILRMLQPYTVTAPVAGTLEVRLREGNPVNPGTLLARIAQGTAEPVEVRSPLPGTVRLWLVREGAAISEGESIVQLAPDETQAWEALRALYLIGAPEDLEEVETYARGVEGMPPRIQEQARLTAEAIRQRAAE